MKCRKCGGSHLSRLRRKGFWQRRIASLFGFYPWECGYCRAISLYRKRGLKGRSRQKDGAVQPKFSRSRQGRQPGATAD